MDDYLIPHDSSQPPPLRTNPDCGGYQRYRRNIDVLETWYHGSHQQFSEFSLDIDRKHKSDAGDLGHGVYFTRSLSRAKCYGSHVYACEIDMSQIAEVTDAYRLFKAEGPYSQAEQLFRSIAFDLTGGIHVMRGARDRWEKESQEWKDTHSDWLENRTRNIHPGGMKTCGSVYAFEEKFETSKQIRAAFLDAGYSGLIACNIYKGRSDDCIQYELVVFDLEAVVSIVELNIPEDDDGWGGCGY